MTFLNGNIILGKYLLATYILIMIKLQIISCRHYFRRILSSALFYTDTIHAGIEVFSYISCKISKKLYQMEN